VTAPPWSSLPRDGAIVVDLAALDRVPSRAAQRVSHITELGEHPEWSGALGGVVWVDIDAGEARLYREPAARPDIDIDIDIDSILLHRSQGPMGAALPRTNGEVVLVASPEISTIDPRSGVVVGWGVGPRAGMRFNDAALSPDGALWVGDLPLEEGGGRGRLLRVDAASGTVIELLSGMGCPNGIVWPSRHEVLVCESDSRSIASARLDPESGMPGSWRIAFRFEGEQECVPDGLFLEADGTMWVAMWGAGKVVRISVAGELIETVSIDDARATSMCRTPDGGLVVTAASGLFRVLPAGQ
jgi:sugar lactone lactonase YvrE